MATKAVRPKQSEAAKSRNTDSKAERQKVQGESFMLAGRTQEEWKERAADRLVQGADWLAGATSRLSDRISTAAHDDKVRERAMKAVGVATSAGGLIASQAAKVDVKAAYQKSVNYAREHPKTMIAGGVAAAAAAYGLYRAVRRDRGDGTTDLSDVKAQAERNTGPLDN